MKLWCTNAINSDTVIDSSNSEFNVVYNEQTYNLTIEEVGYMVRISTHESRLVDKINELFDENNIDAKCLLGVKSYGIEKEAFVVFEVGESNTFEISGSFVDIIGNVE